jgi:hypothetical protein
MQTEIVVALISSILGGLVVAIANNLLLRRKTEAEAAKLSAEAEKFRAETQRIKSEMSKLSVSVEETINERIIYDGSVTIEGYDIKLSGTTPNASELKNGVIFIRRSNNKDIYDVCLRKYIFEQKENEYLPRNELVTGARKIRMGCEAKITRGYHHLLFAFMSTEGKVLDQTELIVDKPEWIEIRIYFRVPSYEDCKLHIVDMPDSLEGSLLVRKLVIAERIEK